MRQLCAPGVGIGAAREESFLLIVFLEKVHLLVSN